MNFMSLGNLAFGNRRLVGYVLLAAALCFLIVPYVFFPQFYIPKAEASMGFVAPASIEGVVLMAFGITLLLVSIGFLKISPRD